MSVSVSIIGASGYVGGELLRILLSHPKTEITQVTSREFKGKPVWKAHPNLRKQTNLKFSSNEKIESADCIFTALPHGIAMKKMPEILDNSKKIIDLSADFRLSSAKKYEEIYGEKHECPKLLKKRVYGIVELHKKEMKNAKLVSGAGCNATAAILALYPLIKEKIIEKESIIIDTKVGSSEGGIKFSFASHHPERKNCVRSYKPTGHRHAEEIKQELGLNKIGFSPHAIDLVRGILCTAHTWTVNEIQEINVFKAFRKHYREEPFIRFVKEKTGIYRYPEPKIVWGTNYCDIGFEKDNNSNRLVVMSAIDNLVKGAAGQAVHAFNVMHKFNEKLGLEFPGLHPI